MCSFLEGLSLAAVSVSFGNIQYLPLVEAKQLLGTNDIDELSSD